VDEHHESVSRNHAVLLLEGNTFVLEDGSSNGCCINGQKLHGARRRVCPGDQIRIGYDYYLSWNDIHRYFPGKGHTGLEKTGRETERINN
jgi:pSer/pThr/pTyr-binding forkhead associated (FHA) protein